jgi:predicted ATPase
VDGRVLTGLLAWWDGPRVTDASVLALEGPVCAGKSTILAALQKEGYTGVEEYMDLPGGRQLSGSGPTSGNAALVRGRALLALEVERMTRLASSRSPVVLDRCALSLLAYELGLAATGRPHIAASITAALDAQPTIRPSRIVYLDCPADVLRARAQSSGVGTPDLYLDDRFNAGARALFAALDAARHGSVVFVRADRSRAQVLASVRSELT